MKKQSTLFIISIFILGLVLISFTEKVNAQIDPGLVSHWDFSQVDSDIIVDKMGLYNATNNFGGILTSNGYSGAGMIFDFDRDGSNASAITGLRANNLPAMEKFTVSFRIKIDNLIQDANEERILTSGSGCLDSRIYRNFLDYSGGRIDISNIDKNTWHYFAFVNDRNTLKFYDNGNLIKSSTVGTYNCGGNDWQFGTATFSMGTDSHTTSDIQLDEIKIYDVALTDSQILEEYNTNDLSCTSDVDIWECSEWTICSIDGQQTRVCSETYNCLVVNSSSPLTVQSCIPECVESSWVCSQWSSCSVDGNQNRTCNKKYNCDGGVASPITSQECTPPCVSDTWSCGDWGICSSGGTQTRSCNKTYDCPIISTPSPETSKSCTPSCSADIWSCGAWSACSIHNSQTRTCDKTFDCPTAATPSPATSQSCAPPQPACSTDTWTCGAWSACSLSGIQNRSCTKTFDCPNTQTAPPITDQYCEPPSRPTPQIPPSGTDEILNQDSIIKSTVKLLCPVNAQMASQGSGTIIDSSGTILTNKHVVIGTLGCLVGFINDFNDEPYFGERQIADIFKVSSSQDIAVLKIRNPQNKQLTSIDITKGNSNLRLGTKITIYGYPAKFGTNITYTSGDFSGTDGNYLKTTAILEYGNSGGGAYLKDGTFIGIPSAVVKGELNALGYILSINTINSWIGNASIISGGTTNNNYSRVSVLENIDLNKLGSLKLFIPDTDDKGDLSDSAKNKAIQNSQNAKEQPQTNQTQKESTIIEPVEQNQQTNLESNQTSPEKTPWFKKIFQKIFKWITNLF